MIGPVDNGPGLKAARHALGLSVNELADRLRFRGDGGRTIREMESGKRPINGTTQTAVELLLRARRVADAIRDELTNDQGGGEWESGARWALQWALDRVNES